MEQCPTCGGEGELTLDGPDDPHAEHDPAWFADCRECFGLAITGCDRCAGTGTTVVAVICVDCGDTTAASRAA